MKSADVNRFGKKTRSAGNKSSRRTLYMTSRLTYRSRDYLQEQGNSCHFAMICDRWFGKFGQTPVDQIIRLNVNENSTTLLFKHQYIVYNL